MMQRGSRRDVRFAAAENHDDDDDDYQQTYFTYRPLSRLPTPPPTLNCGSNSGTDGQPSKDDGMLNPRLRGPAIHLINLIPACASLASASLPFVQAMLARAELPLETVALAVCILDSLDTKFARSWRLSCPLNLEGLVAVGSSAGAVTAASYSTSKRHSLPSSPLNSPSRHLHIDSVRPEIIILAALMIAAKFTEDPQQPPQFFRLSWGLGLWSNEQLNVTERCIMESLDYRILPLCDDDCLTDAMVDMQLAGQLQQSGSCWNLPREPTPPDSAAGSDCEFVPSHSRSKTTLAVGTGFKGSAAVKGD